jgi:DNA repair photolyase
MEIILKENKMNKVKVETKTKLKAISKSDTGFGFCINCYLGCKHGCHYCYSMDVTHKQHTEWINAKPRLQINDLLREDMETLKESPNLKMNIRDIMICSITDSYQPLEKEYRLTREVVKTLITNDLPFTILTKNVNVLEDIDLFRGYGKCRVGLTIMTLDDEFRQKLEPNASPIEERINALKQLKDAGVSTYCSVEPIMPDKRSDPLAVVARVKEYVDLIEFGKWSVKKDSQSNVENILGVKYNQDYYTDLFKQINEYCDTNNINYCHAKHSKSFLELHDIRFRPYLTVLDSINKGGLGK